KDCRGGYPMIKLISVFRRVPNMSLEECQSYWRDTHGQLIKKHAADLRVHRYVQVHTIDDPLNEILRAGRGEIEPFDGMAQVWWRDRDDLEAALTSPEGQRAAAEILEDERNFVDYSDSALWLANEHVFIERTPGVVAAVDSPVVKMSFVFRRLPSMSRQECQSYWRDVHGQMVLRQAADFPLRRYLQSHTLEDPISDRFREERGAAEPYDGVAEMWGVLDELAEAAATPEGQKAADEFLQDERRFIDSTRSSIWLAKEHVVIDG
ncbi:MAG: EthD domain-containing protein, partial [Dehalococcoidia bacterium]